MLVASKRAPLRNRSAAVDVRPASAAKCSGVEPRSLIPTRFKQELKEINYVPSSACTLAPF